MSAQPTTVRQYLASLPPDRRAALSAVRQVIQEHIDPTYVECVHYGMIGWSVPHSVYPAGYHCDPSVGVPFVSLASQKNYMSLYLMCVYGSSEQRDWFEKAWAQSGKKKLDMGQSCVRFKSVDDLALDVIGEAIRRVPARQYIADYQATLATMKSRPKRAKKPASKANVRPTRKRAAGARRSRG